MTKRPRLDETAGGDGEEVVPVRNKTKVLVFSTRGIVPRFRHLMEDLRRLLPHGKSEPKLDTKSRLTEANEVAELRGCNTIMLFDSRKRQDLFLWLSKAPQGPSVKFQVLNVSTMEELKFPGNCLAFSRPLVTFDPTFDSTPEWRLMKELLGQAFSAPKGHRKTKPFVDHVISFLVLDDRIWFRHYQVVENFEETGGEHGKRKSKGEPVDSTLVEIGPRFVLNPIRIFSGSMGGQTLYENPAYLSPNEVRRALRRRRASGYSHRVQSKKEAIERREAAILPEDPLDAVFK